jgi:hypothetical protein
LLHSETGTGTRQHRTLGHRSRPALVGFRNLEPKGILAFDIIDPVPVRLDAEGYLVADQAAPPRGLEEVLPRPRPDHLIDARRAARSARAGPGVGTMPKGPMRDIDA